MKSGSSSKNRRKKEPSRQTGKHRAPKFTDGAIYKSILDSMTEGFVIQSRDGKIIHFNESAPRILGLTPDQLLGRSSVDPRWGSIHEDGSLFPGEQHPALITIKTGKAQSNIIMGITSASHHVRWLQVNSVPFNGIFEGQEAASLATFTDITAEIEKKHELAIRETQLREAQTVAQIGSWSYSLKDQKISWTDELYKLFPHDKSLGPPSLELLNSFVHPEDRLEASRAVQRCIQDGASYTVKHRVVFPDRMIWVEGRGRAVKNSQGEIVSLFGTCQDITDRVRLEQENEFITSALKIGVWKFNPLTNELQWDRSMYSVFGVDPEDFSGSYDAWEKTLTEDSKAEAVKELGLALRGEKEFETTFQIRTKAGEIRFIGGRGIVLRNEKGEAIKMYGINWDKTKETKLEQALNLEKAKSLQAAKLASLGEMSAGIAHEINNPLAIIAGSVSLLKKNSDLPQGMDSRLETIQKAVDRIAKIISGLKKFSRSTENKNYAEHSISQIIKDVMVLTASMAMRHNTSVTDDIQTDSKIVCDDVEIEQVLVNLISNAIDAVGESAEKWVKVSVREEGSFVILRVTDSGPGVPESLKNKIFEPFFTTKPVGQGTGLGLSIAKGILDEHSSSIAIATDQPHSCFELRFKKAVKKNAA